MIKLEKLTKHFGDVQALTDLSVEIQPGEIMGLIGPNGSGKTTTFRLILNLLTPDRGYATWNGEHVTAKHFNDLGYLPEERGLHVDMTIEEQILYFAELRGQSRKKIKPEIEIWMKKFAVKGKATDKIKTLSKGNQQKVQLITTLIHKPKFIILDEPFSGLDPVNADLLIQGILEAKKWGASIIFSSHNMANVEELCDHLVMLINGDTVLNGTVHDIREAYGRTRLFLETPLSREELVAQPGVKNISIDRDGVKRLELETPEYGKALFDYVTKDGYVQTFSQQSPTLEEIFKMKAGEAHE